MLPALRRLMVIGGEEPQGRALVNTLRSNPVLKGTDILTCAGDVEAVQRLRETAIEVVLTDPTTPLREDLALVTELLQTRPGLKTIVLTPQADPNEIVAAIRARVFACFSAPFDFGEIAAMIDEAFRAQDWRQGIEVLSGEPHWMTIRVTCHLLTAERLVQFIREHQKDVPDRERERLMFAFREMLLNAMEHGAGFDAQRVVEVTAARTARALVYHFKDPGNGFDRTDLSSSQRASSPQQMLEEIQRRTEMGLRPGGFGMLLAKEIVDELAYNERGNEVLLIKHMKEK
ncbi:MAG TPA: ATP-binding protein [Terriglobia bacterium]|nr:ATP-binding protein [Terriglobia bacterium]